jgi:hypothetical protein
MQNKKAAKAAFLLPGLCPSRGIRGIAPRNLSLRKPQHFFLSLPDVMRQCEV